MSQGEYTMMKAEQDGSLRPYRISWRDQTSVHKRRSGLVECVPHGKGGRWRGLEGNSSWRPVPTDKPISLSKVPKGPGPGAEHPKNNKKE